MSESFDPKIVEEGPVSIRRNETDENMRYTITDYHANSYPVSDKSELQSLKAAIETVLERDYL